MSTVPPYGAPGDPLDPRVEPVVHEAVVVGTEVPAWLKALAALLAVLWTVGAVGGIWYIAHRIDSTCDTEYVQVQENPDKFQVFCTE
jgi:hypothetical protein